MSERYDDTVHWVTKVMPGVVQRHSGVVRVAHARCHSTLWLRAPDTVVPSSLSKLTFYQHFDGADLFGSAFKLCSILEPKLSEQVILVDTISGLAQELRRSAASLPANATAFMIGSGQWVYFTLPDDDAIHEYDLELSEVSGTYGSVTEVVDEWAEGMSGGA
jgi:hypothetical protein